MVNENRPTHQVKLFWPHPFPSYVLFCGNCESFVDIVLQSKITPGYERWCRYCGHETVYTVGNTEEWEVRDG